MTEKSHLVGNVDRRNFGIIDSLAEIAVILNFASLLLIKSAIFLFTNEVIDVNTVFCLGCGCQSVSCLKGDSILLCFFIAENAHFCQEPYRQKHHS